MEIIKSFQIQSKSRYYSICQIKEIGEWKYFVGELLKDITEMKKADH